MKIYVVRHGQTDWNVKKILQGSSDIPLNDTGIKQAHVLANKICSIDANIIISSPLKRAIDTANIINENLHLPIITSSSLVERNFGYLEGANSFDYDKNLYWDYLKNYKDKDVESVQEFFKRIHDYMNSLINTYTNKNLLLVTHNGVNIAINCFFNGIPDDYNLLNINLDNCGYIEYQTL